MRFRTHIRLRAAGLAVLVAAFAALSAPARAAIRIEVEGVEGEVRGNVYAFLTMERFRYREDLDEDAVRRMYNRIDGEARSALRPFGFYSPEIHSTIEREDDGKNWRVEIQVQAGQPVLIESVDVLVEGPGASDPVFEPLLKQSALKKGDQLHHGVYEQVKGDLQRTAAANGYLDARMLDNPLLVDTEARTARLRIQIETGRQYRFGAIAIEQSVIRPELMRRFLRFHEGEPYSATQLLRTQFALDDSLYFSTVEVLPGERDGEALTVPISIQAKKSDRQFQFGPGYGTDTGVRATFGWTDTRINTLGHRFRVEVRASAHQPHGRCALRHPDRRSGARTLLARARAARRARSAISTPRRRRSRRRSSRCSVAGSAWSGCR